VGAAAGGNVTRTGPAAIRALIEEGFGAINHSGDLPRATADGTCSERVAGSAMAGMVTVPSILDPFLDFSC
jgi:hypothetical protein